MPRGDWNSITVRTETKELFESVKTPGETDDILLQHLIHLKLAIDKKKGGKSKVHTREETMTLICDFEKKKPDMSKDTRNLIERIKAWVKGGLGYEAVKNHWLPLLEGMENGK